MSPPTTSDPSPIAPTSPMFKPLMPLFLSLTSRDSTVPSTLLLSTKLAKLAKNMVKNHAVPEAMINNMLNLAREFFRLPASESLKNFSDDPSKANRLSTSFNVKTAKVGNWRDFLRLHCSPLEDHVLEWPSNPPSFRKVVAEYCARVRGVALRLLEAISESVGLKRDHIDKTLSKHGQHMALNYYPPCPQPELTYGLPGHTDPNLITILLQDNVPGLQVLINGKWVAVNPIPNTFIINIGNQMQVISNDRYKSVLHRAVANCEKERMSIPTFYCPSPAGCCDRSSGGVD
ncbi:hypothetical protein SLEP1_g16274 [Rubroshorea leprosula]|uniref:Fe2OG dioxygenase domain-containing protein n=1 Tax=Rubroshorea leprosula TaxID=152421 RepID=A0AAV5IUA7_9ROSI|nr:hypothetical protein SLEP1_g16274 [Rubroshorea leprosula]